MDQRCEQLFEEAGWSGVYEKHKFKIWMTDCFKDSDGEVLESFFQIYNEEETEGLCFDEFIFQYRLFAIGYKMNRIDKI